MKDVAPDRSTTIQWIDGCTSRSIWLAQIGLERGTGGRQRGEYDPKHYEV